MKPTILLEEEVHKKVMYWVNKSEYEVSGLGMIQVQPEGVLKVVSVMLLPQKNGSAHTDIEAEDVNRALYALRATPGLLQWWWHSHVNMNVFWSGTDMDTIKKIGEGGWVAASVFNKKNEVRSAVYIKEAALPWQTQPLFLDELSTRVTVGPNHHPDWDAEYDKNVKVAPKWEPPAYMKMYGLDNGWEQTEHGVWKRKGSGSAAGNPTATGMTTTDGGSTRKRPVGMSKKEWKRLRREQRVIGLAHPAATHDDGPRFVPAEVVGTEEAETDETDDYGFTKEERALLAREGWEDRDFDILSEADFTPSEMLECAEYGYTAYEIMAMVKQGFKPEDIVEFCEDSVNVRREPGVFDVR
jgi:hypothetical protein